MSAASNPVVRTWDSPLRRGLLLFAAMFVVVVVVGLVQGTASMLLILTQATGFALIALGLNIQWGYGGLFNFAIMGFLMVGGASTNVTRPSTTSVSRRAARSDVRFCASRMAARSALAEAESMASRPACASKCS